MTEWYRSATPIILEARRIAEGLIREQLQHDGKEASDYEIAVAVDDLMRQREKSLVKQAKQNIKDASGGQGHE